MCRNKADGVFGQIRAVEENGNDTLLKVNLTADAGSGMSKLLTGVDFITLRDSDFIL